MMFISFEDEGGSYVERVYSTDNEGNPIVQDKATMDVPTFINRLQELITESEEHND